MTSEPATFSAMHVPHPPEAVLAVPPVHVAAVHAGHKVVGAALLPVGKALQYQTGEIFPGNCV